MIILFFKPFELLVSSLSCSLYRMVHHAVFSILVLLQRNQDVDSLVLEHFFSQREYPIFPVTLSFGDAILEWSSSAIVVLDNLLSRPISDKDFR